MSNTIPFANTLTVTAVNTAINTTGYLSLNGAGALNQSVMPSSILSVGKTMEVKGDINVSNGDVIIDGVSIKGLMASISERLSILTPDPAKLEKFEALKVAYQQYKLLEALCHDKKS